MIFATGFFLSCVGGMALLIAMSFDMSDVRINDKAKAILWNTGWIFVAGVLLMAVSVTMQIAAESGMP